MKLSNPPPARVTIKRMNVETIELYRKFLSLWRIILVLLTPFLVDDSTPEEEDVGG